MTRYFGGQTSYKPVVVEEGCKYDGEYTFATEDILPHLIRDIEQALDEEGIDAPKLRNVNEIAGVGRRRLMSMAVNDWGYLGENTMDHDDIIQAWNAGLLDYLIATQPMMNLLGEYGESS